VESLTAEVSLAGDRLDVEIVNAGDEPVRFSTATMIGSAAFKVTDADGRPVALGPPPMPPADLETPIVALAPGESTTLTFRRGDLFPDGPPPGRSRLRFAAAAPPVADAWSGRVESPWVELSP
jgi:hypothetical protein